MAILTETERLARSLENLQARIEEQTTMLVSMSDNLRDWQDNALTPLAEIRAKELAAAKLRFMATQTDYDAMVVFLALRLDTEHARCAAARAEAEYWARRPGDPHAP